MHLVLQVVRTANALESAAARLFRPHGLSPAQFNVLNLLGLNPAGLRAGDLAAQLIVDPSNVTRLLQRLKREKLIAAVPSPEDRREHIVVLTPAGRARWAKAQRVYEAALAEMERHAGLTATQRELIGRSLDALHDRSHELHR